MSNSPTNTMADQTASKPSRRTVWDFIKQQPLRKHRYNINRDNDVSSNICTASSTLQSRGC